MSRAPEGEGRKFLESEKERAFEYRQVIRFGGPCSLDDFKILVYIYLLSVKGLHGGVEGFQTFQNVPRNCQVMSLNDLISHKVF